MECIDKNPKSSEERDELIERFAFDRMTEDEEIDFCLHIGECDSCRKDTESFIKFTKAIDRSFTYKDLNKAAENKEWEEVVELGNEMYAKDYSEDVYKVKDMVRDAMINLTYQELSDAHDKKEWKTVLTLSNKLEKIGYDEEKFPLKEKIWEAKGNLIYKKFSEAYSQKKWNVVLKLSENLEKSEFIEKRNTQILVDNIKEFLESEEDERAAKGLFQITSELIKRKKILLCAVIIDHFKTAKNMFSPSPLNFEEWLTNTTAHFFEQRELDLLIHFAQAIINTKQISEQFPILLTLAYGYMLKKDFDAAESIFKVLCEMRPEDLDALQGMGRTYLGNQKFVEANKLLKKVYDFDPNRESIWADLGNSYLQLNDPVKAEYYLQKAIKVLPDDILLRNTLGISLIMNGKYSEAEDILLKGFKNFIKNTDKKEQSFLYASLGFVYSHQNKFDAAEKAFIQSISLKEDNFHALNNLGMLYLDNEKFNSALRYLKKAYLIENKNPSICSNLAIAYAFQENWDNAIKYIELAHELAPDDLSVKANYDTILKNKTEGLSSMPIHHRFFQVSNL